MNRLRAGAHALYDPLGRLRETVGASTTQFLYDGDRLVEEYIGSGIVRRYVHGAGVDEPLIWYEGSGFTNGRWLLADNQGSIIADPVSGGAATAYKYGPYGEPDIWQGARFRYTGQITLPEAQLSFRPRALRFEEVRNFRAA